MHVSPTYDTFTAGSLASATLCAQPAEAPAPAGPAFAASLSETAASAPLVARKCGWRRLVEAILSPISGPTLCGQR
ncbi:MAG: hypothetical protein KGM15_08250, partial [Pseudomonadota bacterium]|nr:hypothetical protein [Pseudomonadota bacterium]